MHSLTYPFALLPLLPLALAAPEPLITFAARMPQVITINGATAGITITGSSNFNGQDCPGVIALNDPDNYCCVGGTPFVSVCEGWPICGSNPTTTSGGVGGCVASVPFSASDYSALVSSAVASGSGTVTVSGNGGATTGQAGESGQPGESGQSGESGAPAETSTAGGEGAATAATTAAASSSAAKSSSSAVSSKSSGGGAAAFATAGAMLPLGVIGGGLLGLAALL